MGKKETPIDKKPKDAEMAEKKKHTPPSSSLAKEEKKEDMAIDSELFDSAPEEVKRMITMALSQTHVRGPMPNPLFSKIEGEHIHKFLDLMSKDDTNQYKLTSSNRFFSLAYTIIILAFFIFLIVFLIKENKDLLLEIFKILVAFIGGVGGGFGLKTSLDKKKINL
ncbi:MAG: hypothetical protein AB7E04_08525 [Desulfobacteraceae bacterium]